MILRNISAGLLCVAMAGFAASGPANKLTAADRRFITAVADDNMIQAHLGQMAENRAAGASVKDFARTLAGDHSKAYGELLKLAEQQGDTAVPRGINIRTDHAAVGLMRLKGAQFDRAFVRDEIAGHQRAIAEFKREAAHGGNPELKAWAQRMVPVLEGHLNTAKELEKSSAKGGRMMAKKS